MSELFLKIINMSISASWLVLAVLVIRLLMKKAPKWVSVMLWGIVAIRLLCPFSIESALSLIPSAETVPMNIETAETPSINSGVNVVNNAINPVINSLAPDFRNTVTPLQIWVMLLSIVWISGMALFLIYTIISYWRLRRKIDTAVIYKKNIFQSENVDSPFVLGIIRPRIYLPFNINEQSMEYVVAHEEAHIRRRDHWWKPLGFFLLTIHWFNPLIWIAYILLCRDVELACDEKVIKKFGDGQRADYSQTLVACSVNRRMIAACPIAFGEVGVKDRVKSVMNYKKPAFWIVVVAVVSCVVVAACFLTNPPVSADEKVADGESFNLIEESTEEGNTDEMGATETETNEDPREAAISKAILEQYAGDNSEGLIHVESHVLLANECKSGTPVVDADTHVEEETVYLLVLQEKYSTYDSRLEEVSGSYIPTAITFFINERDEYTLKEYWEPRDGSFYVKDIRKKFPGVAADDALNDQKYIDELQKENKSKAKALMDSNGSIDSRIAELFDIIQSSPVTSSNPDDYIKAHEKEYKELLSYDQFTIRYCFMKFLLEEQTDLLGHIMAKACEEINMTWGEAILTDGGAETGQDWFDAFKDNALRLSEQYSDEDMQKYYPSSSLLLNMMNE